MKIGRDAWSRVDQTIFTERVRNFITQALEQANFEETVKDINSRPKTLIMGDFHARNVFYDLNRDQVIMSDFAEIGIGDPMSDLVKYILSDIDTSVRRKHETEVLMHYYQVLTAHGVDKNVYSFDDLISSYKTSLDLYIVMFAV